MGGLCKTLLIMSDFIERLVDEKNELDAKFAKLEVFMMKDAFKKIGKRHQDLLNNQLKAMKEYSSILHERLVLLQE